MTEHTKEPWQHTAEPWETWGATKIFSREAGANIAAVSELRSTVDVRYDEPRIGSENFTEICHNALRIVACVNGCAGLQNPEAVKDVVDALEAMIPEWWDKEGDDTSAYDGKLCGEITFGDVRRARAALAKLKG